jgi:hypothetical protein
MVQSKRLVIRAQHHKRRWLAGIDVRRNVLSRTRQVGRESGRLSSGLDDDCKPGRRRDLAAPDWALIVSNVARAGTSIAGGYATLLHNGVLIGVGQCAQRTVPTAATVGDVAPE